MAARSLLIIVITYDIACQWERNLQVRMSDYPEHLQIPPTTRVEAAVPSWHINGHGDRCQTECALAYKPGMGRTCGDEIEGSFSHSNSLGVSYREMGPAGRHEAVNAMYSSYNMEKIVKARTSLHSNSSAPTHSTNNRNSISRQDPKCCEDVREAHQELRSPHRRFQQDRSWYCHPLHKGNPRLGR